jgi:hypothetical protein
MRHYEPTPDAERECRRNAKRGAEVHGDLLHRAVLAVQTPEGLRALSKDRPITPAIVQCYLEGKFGDRLGDARTAMERFGKVNASTRTGAERLCARRAISASDPDRRARWGAAGDLELHRIIALAI